jgi:hypothetical protein
VLKLLVDEAARHQLHRGVERLDGVGRVGAVLIRLADDVPATTAARPSSARAVACSLVEVPAGVSQKPILVGTGLIPA